MHQFKAVHAVDVRCATRRESPQAPSPVQPPFAMHKAPNPIELNPNLLFRREADRYVKRKVGKQLLDVGAACSRARPTPR